jgi:hypothetical protein
MRRTRVLVALSGGALLLASSVGCEVTQRSPLAPPSADVTVSDGPASDVTASDGTASDVTASDGPASDGTASDGTASDGTASDGTASDGAVNDVTASDVTASDAPVGDVGAGGEGGGGFGAELEGWIQVYQRGGTLDFDRDGRVDTTVTVAPDGTQTIVVAGTRGPRVRSVVRSLDDYETRVDDNDDGTFDITRTSSTIAGVTARVETRDRNFDGTPDLRVTQTRTTAMVEEFMRPRTGGAPRWVITRAGNGLNDYVSPSVTSCTPPADIAPPTPGPSTPPATGFCGTGCSMRCFYDNRAALEASSVGGFTSLPSTSVRLLNRGMAACSAEQMTRINTALVAVGQDLARIRSINAAYVDEILTSLSRVRLFVGCAIPACAPTNTLAWTQAWRHRVWEDPSTATVLLNPSTLNLTNAAVRGPAVRELLVHELFHLSESHEDYESTNNGYEARDHIYACARFAVRWAAGLEFYLGTTRQASSARDAATCASMDHKRAYGVGSANLRTDRFFVEILPGAEMDVPVCSIDAMTMPASQPDCAVVTYQTYCDQTPVPAAERNLAQRHQGACTTRCPPYAPYEPDSCTLRSPLRIDEIYDRVASTNCVPVSGAVY